MDSETVTTGDFGALDIAFCREPENPAVCVVDGYGASLTTSSGRLVVKDGIGRHRRTRTYTRATHGLARVVVLADSGHITLDAIRWMDGVGISWCMVNKRDGALLSCSTHAAADDARIRRSQALAMGDGVGFGIATGLVDLKLAGQAAVAREMLELPILAGDIEGLRERLAESATLEELRALEAAAANLYWAGWGTVIPTWVRKDEPRVPQHWKGFTGRSSSINQGNRNATTPVNAMLGLSYKLLEVEAVLALRAVGLEPGLGILHADALGRASLALDLLEAVRPEVDRHVLRILRTTHLRWRDFDEDDRGVVRVLAPLTHRLAEATPSYARSVAPIAELVAESFGRASPYGVSVPSVLTRKKHREVSRTVTRRLSSGETFGGATPTEIGIHLRHMERQKPRAATSTPDVPMPVCVICGAVLEREASRARRRGAYCADCLAERRRELGTQVQRLGTATSAPGPETRARQAMANSEQRLAEQRWELEHEGEVPDREWYLREVLPCLAEMTTTAIAKATGMSTSSASKVRAGKRVPHPRWWLALIALSEQQESNS